MHSSSPSSSSRPAFFSRRGFLLNLREIPRDKKHFQYIHIPIYTCMYIYVYPTTAAASNVKRACWSPEPRHGMASLLCSLGRQVRKQKMENRQWNIFAANMFEWKANHGRRRRRSLRACDSMHPFPTKIVTVEYTQFSRDQYMTCLMRKTYTLVHSSQTQKDTRAKHARKATIIEYPPYALSPPPLSEATWRPSSREYRLPKLHTAQDCTARCSCSYFTNNRRQPERGV